MENKTTTNYAGAASTVAREVLKKSHSNYFCNGSGKLIYVIYKNADNEVYYIP